MKKQIIYLFLTCLMALPLLSKAQNVGIGTSIPANSALLDVSSTSKGILTPRMTSTQRNAITGPEFGLIVFDTDKGTLMFFDGVKWCALSFTSESGGPAQTRTSNNPVTSDQLGYSVAISGNYAVVGTPNHSGLSINESGTAYVFTKTASGWQQQTELVIPDPFSGDRLGFSVAISGDYIALGSPYKQVGSNSSQGKVYIFKRDGTTWVQDTALIKPSGIAYDYFGLAIALSATSTSSPLLSIGIPSSGSDNKGEIYTYQRDGNGTWAFMQSIAPFDLANDDYFGQDISMDGDYMVIGCPYQDVNDGLLTFSNAGSVYIYALSGSVWTQQQKLVGANVSNLLFGSSLGLSGNTIAIGAPGASYFPTGSAGVYTYTRSGTNWNSSSVLYLSAEEGGTTAMMYGYSLSLSGNNMVIGAPSNSISGLGRAYTYKRYSADGNFVNIKELQSDVPRRNNKYGFSVAVDGGNCAIGAPGEAINGMYNAGSVSFDNISE